MTEPVAEEPVTIASFRDLTEFVAAEIDSGKMWAGWSGGRFSYGESARESAPTDGEFVGVDVSDRFAVGVLVGAIGSHLVALRAQANAPKPPNRQQRRTIEKGAQKRVDALWTPGKPR